jgi:P4 family phage/plasmid primase-like protien
MADDDEIILPKDPKAKLIWLNEEKKKRRQQQRQKQAEAPTHDEMATEFAAIIAGRFKYVRAWGWCRYTGTHWVLDRLGRVVMLARQYCRQQAQDYDMRKLADVHTIRAVVELAQVDENIAADADIWDKNPWLLNTPTGTIDLKNRTTRIHDPADFITRITKVSPGGDCQLWKAHWALVVPDAEQRAFLRRYFGFALTGVPADRLVFCFGTGRNGRSTIINTVRRAMGTYAGAAPASTFAKKRHEAHSTELARLHALRLVTTSENTRGSRWDEERLKLMTGGDPIVARFMRRDDFEFTPEFKIVISGNNKPDLDTVDVAMRARLLLMPFEVTIAKDKREQNYFERLEPELGGILEDLLAGNYEWQEKGLAPPQSVIDATDEFMDSQDRIARWLGDCCDVAMPGSKAAKDISAETMELFKSWQRWTIRTGEKPGTMVAFVEALKATGKFKHSTNKGRTKAKFSGLCLKKEETEENQRDVGGVGT